LPDWQLYFFPGLVLLACLVCLFYGNREEPGRRSFAQFLVLTFLFTAGFLFFSRLQVAEHHLVILLPLAIAIVVVACSTIQARFRRATVVSVMLLCIYGASAASWQVQSLRGLRDTGGTGVWSNSGLELASYLDQGFRDRKIRLLDWGLLYNIYVLTDGKIKPREIYSGPSEDLSDTGRPWLDEIRDGGVFVLNGSENRQFPKPSAGFLRVLATARPVMRLHNIAQHNGATYAEVVDIVPDSIRGLTAPGDATEARIRMNSPGVESQLVGFYAPDSDGFRWTKREFSATLMLPPPRAGGTELFMRVYIPEAAISSLGTMTLRAQFGGHALAPESWATGGIHVFRRELNDTFLGAGLVHIDFSLDKTIPASAGEQRQLGILVGEIAVQPE
jgi:hypothetical protein